MSEGYYQYIPLLHVKLTAEEKAEANKRMRREIMQYKAFGSFQVPERKGLW